MINLQTRKTRLKYHSNKSGFTLVEVLVVVVIITILATLGIPSWMALVDNSKLTNAQGEVLQAMRNAQSRAQQRKTTWEVRFQNGQNDDGQPVIQWSVNSGQGGSPAWQTISITGVKIDESLTNLEPGSGSSWLVQFDHRGQVSKPGDLGPNGKKITLVNNSGRKKCVIVRTILGSMTTAEGASCEN